MAVDDVVADLEGWLSVSGKSGSVTAGPGQKVTICSHEQDVITAFGELAGETICHAVVIGAGAF